MTHKTRSIFPSGKPKKARPSASRVGFCILSVFCLLLVFRNADAAIEYMGRGLTLCARTVIPSLFPFMVVSELLVSSGAGEALGRLFAGIMKRIFGLSGAGASAVFLGSMCGFPVGARTAVALLDRNAISKKECEHLLTFVSNPSSAFLITAVGMSLYGNRRLGVVLYITVLGCGFFVGFLARFFLKRGGEPAEHPHFPSGLRVGSMESVTSAVAGAVSSAASGMMTVCAYVIFFSAITGALECILPSADGMGRILYTLVCGLLEMTGGIGQASATGSDGVGVILTAAFAGWSGISVHCQIMTLCGGRGLSFKPYLIAKAAQGLLCGGVMAILLRWHPDLLSSAEGRLTDAIAVFTSMRDIPIPALLSNGIFVAGWVLSYTERDGRGDVRQN